MVVLVNHIKLLTVKLFLLGLIVLGGFPPFEVRHAHAGGFLPHEHLGEGDRPCKPFGKPVSHDHDHVHDHENYPQRPVRESVNDQDSENGIPVSSQEPTTNEDWHHHLTWLGLLVGTDWQSAELTDSQRPGLSCDTYVSSFLGSDEVIRMSVSLVSGNWIHGPPKWLRFMKHKQTYNLTYRYLLGSGSPPLCDVSRHERSGVLLS